MLEEVYMHKLKVAETFKNDGTTTVARTPNASNSFIVKRYNTKNKWHFVRRLLRRSRAHNCWEMSEVFARAGLHTPQRVAVIQEQLGPFKLRSWFISEYINGPDLLSYLSNFDNHNDGLTLKDLKEKVYKLFEQLYSNHLSHGDMKASNILIHDNTLILIDLDAAHQCTNVSRFKRAAHKDWARFMKNWRGHPSLSKLFAPIENKLSHT